MKEFLEYNDDNIIVTTDGKYIDFYNNDIVLENLSYEVEDEATLGYLIHEPTLEELKEIKKLKEDGDNIHFEYDEENCDKNKEYLEDFDYVDTEVRIKKKIKFNQKIVPEQNIKEKPKKIKKQKIKKENKFLMNFLNFIYFVLKVIFLLFLYFMIFSISRYSYLQEKYNEDENEIIIDFSVDESLQQVKVSPELIVFKELMIEKCIALNEIIEGEKDCIEKLNNNQISLYEASIYFDKTQLKKQTILNEFYDENVKEEFYGIQNYLKEMYIYSINLSKQIKIRYNNSENNSLVVNDFNTFMNKHNERISEYEFMLENFK